MIHAIGPKIPRIDDSAYIAWNAEVAGDVSIGARASIWFSATVRGDIASIEIGEGSNIQDGAVVHVDTDVPCKIGKDVTVGHGAILHSCVVGDGTLIGMGAIVLNGAEIGPGSIVGAGALVTQGKKFPPRSLIIGSPAKVTRELSEEESSGNLRNAAHYVDGGREARKNYRVIKSE
ncbi:MAG: gamma carbonic anhydrase family protein [Treponemataceae bacterium]|jgi:carbonic anhydrase/acetyltransferase-like protein (isoleucine patch superfamily)